MEQGREGKGRRRRREEKGGETCLSRVNEK
jgi:hypothetical protein